MSTYRKVTRERLTEVLRLYGYSVTKQSSDGTYQLIRDPKGNSTKCWLFSDRFEVRLEDKPTDIVIYFNYKDCFIKTDENSVSLIVNGIKHHGVFTTFFNFSKEKANDNAAA